MNRLCVLLLAIAYLASSSGKVVCTRSCGKFFKQLSLAALSNKAEGKCCSRSASKREAADPTRDGCCHDGACAVKAKTCGPKFFFPVQPLHAAVCGPPYLLAPPPTLAPAAGFAAGHRPAEPPRISLYLRHCAFLI